jgi:hypothetical protein
MDKRHQIYNRLYSKAATQRRFLLSERHNIHRLRRRLHRLGFHYAARFTDSDVLRVTVRGWQLQWRMRVSAETALMFVLRNYRS